MKRKLKIAFLALFAFAATGFAWLWFAPCGFGGCAPVSELEKYQAEGSQLLDREGEPFATLATVNRRIVSLDSLPEHLPQAFIAVEDRRFYGHGGVDWQRFVGALSRNVRAGGVEEGASTITMQLARNLFPEHLPYTERSIRRKAMEIRVARQIERAFDKRKILELYLNHIYLGERAYGVEAAAQTYFGKPAAELTLAEAATIGGLGQRPSDRNPRADREAARKRRDVVLQAMADAKFITEAEARAAMEEPIRLARRGKTGAERGSYFVERVRRELEERVGERVYTAGLKVYTTYDPVAQRAAEEEMALQMKAIESGEFGAYRHPTYAAARGETEDGATTYLQGVAVVMESRTGEIRALVGGRDFDDSKFDRVFQARRQPGSAFKPFVYLAALEQGLPPTEVIEDAPIRMVLSGGRVWSPRNYTGQFDGPITLRDALTRSKNTVTVRVAERVGMGTVIRTAQELGVTSPIPDVPATALGAAEVSPIELVRAYAAFGNGGELVEPHVVQRVEDRDGRVVWEAEEARVGVLDPEVAYVLTSLLRDVVDRGTGTPVRTAGFRGPAAGKTGTTNGATDVWFVGYTPDLVGAVWFGLDRPATVVRGASGGTIAAPVWGRIMRRVYADRPMPGEWAPPRGVVTEVVDRRTGYPVDAGCPVTGETYTEYFVRVRPPRPLCQQLPPYAYPPMAMDSMGVWVDEEWGAYAYDPDTVGLSDLEKRGIDWPALEEQRRREAAGEPLPPIDPLPPPPPVATDGSTRTRPRVTPPPVDEPPASGDVDGDGVDGAPPPPRERRDPPRVLGEPVGGQPETPAPAPAPPDTSAGAPG